jgi:hypothetical protein
VITFRTGSAWSLWGLLSGLRVDVHDDGGLDVTWRRLFGAEQRHVAPWDVFPAGVVRHQPYEGIEEDISFICRVVLQDGTWLDLAQSGDRAEVQAVVDRFNAVAGKRPFR